MLYIICYLLYIIYYILHNIYIYMTDFKKSVVYVLPLKKNSLHVFRTGGSLAEAWRKLGGSLCYPPFSKSFFRRAE